MALRCSPRVRPRGGNLWGILVVVALALATACGGQAGSPTAATGGPPSPTAMTTASPSPTATSSPMAPASPTPQPTPTAEPVSGEVVVFAAASLTDAFQEIGQEFQAKYPGTRMTFNFAGSSALRTQLAQGAKADVFASADEKNMRGAQEDGTVAGEPQVFVRNTPVVVVPAGNPAGIAEFKDLAKPGVRLVLEAKDVPIGNYARQILAKASDDPAYGRDFADRVLANVVSEETNVKAALTKVALGEADATFVYASDVTPDVRDKVRVVEVPEQFNVVAEYYIAITKEAPNPAGGRAFIDFVLSPEGQAILEKWGFTPIER